MTLGIINTTNKEVINKKNIIREFSIFKLDKMNKGINFWIVDNKNKIHKDDLLIIEINQPWNGADPNFIIILKISKRVFELKKKKEKVKPVK